MCHATTYQKKAGVTILISDKADFRSRRILRNKGALHDDKWDNSPKDITILTIEHQNM